MEIELKLLDSIEAYLRRASTVDLPFMVKGSILTRQYFPNPEMRIVADLDWVYLNYIDRNENAGALFSDWATKVTETIMYDGAQYRSFRENDFWRYIDYAMNDDFPTVDTDLICRIDEEDVHLGLDISYNLDIDYAPVEILYQPRRGAPFPLKHTCPLPLQISWKLHQTLVRPRIKDIFDLIHLLPHPSITETVMRQAVLALKKECDKDKIDMYRMNWFIDGRMEEYHKLIEFKLPNTSRWEFLSTTMPDFQGLKFLSLDHHPFTKQEHFKYNVLSELFHDFSKVLKQKGIDQLLKTVLD